MIIVYILVAICFIISGFSLYGIFYIQKKNKETINILNSKLEEYENNFNIIKNQNTDFISNNSKKYNELVLRLNSFEKILQTFNNGFTPREGYF